MGSPNEETYPLYNKPPRVTVMVALGGRFLFVGSAFWVVVPKRMRELLNG